MTGHTSWKEIRQKVRIAELEAGLRRIGYIAQTQFEDSGEMANAIDKIQDIVDAALSPSEDKP